MRSFAALLPPSKTPNENHSQSSKHTISAVRVNNAFCECSHLGAIWGPRVHGEAARELLNKFQVWLWKKRNKKNKTQKTQWAEKSSIRWYIFKTKQFRTGFEIWSNNKKKIAAKFRKHTESFKKISSTSWAN